MLRAWLLLQLFCICQTPFPSASCVFSTPSTLIPGSFSDMRYGPGRKGKARVCLPDRLLARSLDEPFWGAPVSFGDTVWVEGLKITKSMGLLLTVCPEQPRLPNVVRTRSLTARVNFEDIRMNTRTLGAVGISAESTGSHL